MTQAELLVAMALLGLLLLVLVPFLVSALRIGAIGTERGGLQAQASLALLKLSADLQSSSPAGISRLTGDPTVVAVVAISNVTSQGSLAWDDHCQAWCHLPTQHRLLRKRWPPGPPAAVSFSPGLPPRLDDPTLRALAQTTNGQEVILADTATLFEVTPDSVTGAFLLRLRVERQVVSGRVESFDLQRTVQLRNQGNPQG